MTDGSNALVQLPIYMDNHASTRLDPRVLDAMAPVLRDVFGNAGSTTHVFGRVAKEAVDAARQQIAALLGGRPQEIVFTSGATESNNLAIKGVAAKHGSRGKHILTVATEHPSLLDPLATLARAGFEVTILPVTKAPDARAGLVDVEQVAAALRNDTILVSVMLANSEIGALQPVAEIGHLCRRRGVLLHTDATQAVGKIPVNVQDLHVDLMSFTAHKIYGPKGVGALWVRRGRPPVRLLPLINGGGQEGNLRSGTLNTPGIVGFARALQLCADELFPQSIRLRGLRDRLYAGLTTALPGVLLNGPALLSEQRLPGNLNLSFANVEGESLLMSLGDVALSSGSACASAQPEPSHVLRALGLADEVVYSSVRFGLGRFNTADEVEFTITRIAETVRRLRAMS
jgi:cysteine desulfurase